MGTAAVAASRRMEADLCRVMYTWTFAHIFGMIRAYFHIFDGGMRHGILPSRTQRR